MVFVILRRCSHAAVPPLLAERRQVDRARKQQAAGGQPQADDDGTERRLAAAGDAFQEHAFLLVNREIHLSQKGLFAAGIGEGKVARGEHFG